MIFAGDNLSLIHGSLTYFMDFSTVATLGRGKEVLGGMILVGDNLLCGFLTFFSGFITQGR